MLIQVEIILLCQKTETLTLNYSLVSCYKKLYVGEITFCINLGAHCVNILMIVQIILICISTPQ